MNHIEEDLIVSCYLHLIIAFNEEYVTSCTNCMVMLPVLLLRDLIFLKLEEQNLTWWTSHKNFVLEQVHLSEIYCVIILVGDLLVCESWFITVDSSIYIRYWHTEWLTLAIEGVYFILFWTVETFPRKIFVVTFQFFWLMARNFIVFIVVNEMVMGECCIVEEVDKEELMINEGTVDEWVWKVVDWNGVIINV